MVWVLGFGSARVAQVDLVMFDEFVAAGDTSRCRAMIDRLLKAGADRVVLVPNPAGFRSTASMVEQIRTAAALTRTVAPGGAG